MTGQQIEVSITVEISHHHFQGKVGYRGDSLRWAEADGRVVLDAIDTVEVQRSAFQRQLAFWSERQIEVSEKQLLGICEVVRTKSLKRKDELFHKGDEKAGRVAEEFAAYSKLPKGTP